MLPFIALIYLGMPHYSPTGQVPHKMKQWGISSRRCSPWIMNNNGFALSIVVFILLNKLRLQRICTISSCTVVESRHRIRKYLAVSCKAVLVRFRVWRCYRVKPAANL